MSALARNTALSCVLIGLLAAGAAAAEPLPPAAQQAIQEYEARMRLAEALTSLKSAEVTSQVRFRGMLGSYFNQEGQLPFILLSVPNGENVFSDYARQVMNGKYDFSKPLTRFQAHGHVAIPQEGTYYLEANRGYGDFKLNGLGYSLGEQAPLNRFRALVVLKPGVYEVEYSVNNNGGQLPGASVRILMAETEQELPIFVYESELEAFQSELGECAELLETSKWTQAEHRLE